MVVAIDAVRYAAELEAQGDWQMEDVDSILAGERQEESGTLAPARGMFWGLLVSTAMWVALVAGVRAMMMLAR